MGMSIKKVILQVGKWRSRPPQPQTHCLFPCMEEVAPACGVQGGSSRFTTVAGDAQGEHLREMVEPRAVPVLVRLTQFLRCLQVTFVCVNRNILTPRQNSAVTKCD